MTSHVRGILSLPPELREQIFTLALHSQTKSLVTFRLESFQRESYTEATQPPLTRVSRQIRAEALPLFYKVNDFVVHTHGKKSEDALLWLSCVRVWLEELRHVVFWVRYQSPPTYQRGIIGAIAVEVAWDARRGQWRSRDGWRWVPVCKRPDEVEADGLWLAKEVDRLAMDMRRESMDVEEFAVIMRKLNEEYNEHKLG